MKIVKDSKSTIQFFDTFSRDYSKIDNVCGELLDPFGKGRKVVVLKSESGSDTFRIENKAKQNWKVTALKILAWLGSGFLLPLLFLALKAGHRWHQSKRISKLSPEQINSTIPSPSLSDKKTVHPIIEQLNRDDCKLWDLGFHSFEEAKPFLLAHKESIQRINLEANVMSPWSIDDKAIAFLSQLPNLKSLNISKQELSDNILKEVNKLKGLEELEMRGMKNVSINVTQCPLEGLFSLTSLKHLAVDSSLFSLNYIQDLTISKLKELKNLEKLEIGFCFGWGDPQIQSLVKAVPHIHSLKIRGAFKVTDHGGLKALSTLTNLRELALDHMKLDGSGFIYLSNLQHLEKLSLVNTIDPKECEPSYLGNMETHASHFKHLGALKNLKELTIGRNCLNDKGILFLTQLKGLKSLAIDIPHLSDDGLRVIAELKQLKHLSLRGRYNDNLHDIYSDISDKGLKHLLKLTELQHLSFTEFTSITTEGLMPLVDTLPITSINFKECPKVNPNQLLQPHQDGESS